MQVVGLKTIGRLQGRAIVRDKDGNVKGELILDSEMTVEQAAAVAGVSPKQMQERISFASQESLHGRNSDHSGS